MLDSHPSLHSGRMQAWVVLFPQFYSHISFIFGIADVYKSKYGIEFPKTIDTFSFSSRIPPNMFRDRASILMEAKAKRKPTSATSVVGFGHVSVEQEIKRSKA
jgi:hypothetical protein